MSLFEVIFIFMFAMLILAITEISFKLECIEREIKFRLTKIREEIERIRK